VSEKPDQPPQRTSLQQLDEFINQARGGLAKAAEDPPEARKANAEADDAEQDVALKRHVSRVALIAMGVQIVVADVVFILYCHFNEWAVPTPAIVGWLSATVVEVVSVVVVITNYLFPNRSKR
jgi:hypothetical protein